MARPGSGPIPARVMIVGEAYGEAEERALTPFVGSSGSELDRMLHDAGLMRSECYATNLVNARPMNNDIGQWFALRKKDITDKHVQLNDRMVLPIVVDGYNSLMTEIDLVKPKVIVPVGNTSMWALTGKWGITKWRASHLECKGIPVIPTYHPAAILRQWDWRAVAVEDLRRAARFANGEVSNQPKWNFRVRPSFSQVVNILSDLLGQLEQGELWIDFDLETRAGHIACAGISWTRLDAVCVPFMCLENREGYWSPDEETEIVWLLYRVLTHRNVKVRWQNGLYDAQYTYKHWHFIPRGAQDTMISQHAIFSDLPKSLAFQASMYCDHYVFWKDEGKTWEATMNEEDFWRYNCIDCVRTREVGEVELETANSMKLSEVHDFQQEMFWPVLQAMLRGVRVIPATKQRLANEIQDELSRREEFLHYILGHPLNPASHPQMTTLFYQDLGQTPIISRPKKGVPGHLTCDDEALQKISSREPLLRPLVNAIADIRTLGIFNKTFVLMRLDEDGRARCSYNIGGSESGASAPKTYRLSSSKSAFGSGANLQTIPSDKSKSVGKAEQRGTEFKLPNIRSMFGPDPGYTFFDMDLDRADLQVVVWEADDPLLKAALRLGTDVHLLNVYTLDGREPPPLEELVETHPKYWDHRGPRKHKREFSKVFCHGTNYGGQPRTMAAHTGRTVHEIDRAQKLWFGAHPGITKWHERTKAQIHSRRYIENKFGYRWYIFDRIDQAFTEALAWVPQSTVACLINRIWLNIYKSAPEVWTLLQVHDSLAGQFPTHIRPQCISKLKSLSHITVPYDDPLVIPTGVKTSETSWGDCV